MRWRITQVHPDLDDLAAAYTMRTGWLAGGPRVACFVAAMKDLTMCRRTCTPRGLYLPAHAAVSGDGVDEIAAIVREVHTNRPLVG